MEIQKINQGITKITSTTSLIKCFQENDVIALAEYSTSLTIKAAKEGTSLAVLKASDPSTAIKAVGSAIVWLQKSLNIKEPMNDFQIADAAITLVNTYYWLRFEELVMILGRIKTGKTGKLYHMFDVQVFCQIIEEYLKSNELAEYHEKTAAEFKKVERDNKTNEGLQKVYERLYDSYKQDAEKISLETKEYFDDDGKRILIRHADYYHQLNELLPSMSKEEIELLRSSYIRSNYKDGISLINKFLKEDK